MDNETISAYLIAGFMAAPVVLAGSTYLLARKKKNDSIRALYQERFQQLKTEQDRLDAQGASEVYSADYAGVVIEGLGNIFLDDVLHFSEGSPFFKKKEYRVLGREFVAEYKDVIGDVRSRLQEYVTE